MSRQATWDELYLEDAFDSNEFGSHEDSMASSELFKYTELLQNEGNLREIDIMRLQNVIRSAFELGKLRGAE
jgi:hypothetical protein